MTILFTILHVLVCMFLILVVLAQQGKGQDLASAFGGAGSQTAFGARGTATLLSKITAGAAVLFMVTSLMLSYLRPATGPRTVVPEAAPASETTTPPAEEGAAAPTEEPEEGATGEEAGPPATEEAAPAETPPAETEPAATTTAPQNEPQ